MMAAEIQALKEAEELITQLRGLLAFAVDERATLLDMISKSTDLALIEAAASHMRKIQTAIADLPGEAVH